MSILKANECVKNANKQLKHFYSKYCDIQSKMNTMRYSYFKELQSLKEMLYRQKNYPESFEYMDIQYFSAIDVLDDKTRELLNSKITDVKNLFNEKMLDLYKTNEILNKQVYMFKEIEKTGNIGIKFSEMNCEDIICKLQIIEDNPLTIWKCIQKYYGYGFFNVMIEKEYGINPNTYEEISESFNGQITILKDESLEKLELIEEQAKLKYDDILEKFLMYEQQIIILKESNEKEIESLKQNLNKLLQESIIEIEKNYFNKYDEEKQELFEHIRILKIQLARAKGKDDGSESIANRVGMYEEGLSGLSFIDDPEDEKDHLINKLQKELYLLTQEYRDMVNEKENYKFLSLKAEKDREYLIRKANNYKHDHEVLMNKFIEFKQNCRNFEKEAQIIQKAYHISSSFVDSLQEEVETLRIQFRLLEGMIPKDKLSSFEKQSPFQFMRKKNDMAKHSLNIS